jgi:amino acid transporter
MMLALGAIVLSYVVPIAAVWHTHIPQDVWNNGSWASIAGIVVGRWLGMVLVSTAMLAEFSSFNSLVMSYSHLPSAMAEDGHLPKIFARKNRSGAPWVAIVVLGLGWGLSLGLNFKDLVMLDILLYGASLVLEFLALIILRVREPQLPRPFRVPGGMAGAVLAGVGPTALVIVALLANRGQKFEVGRYSVSQLGFGLGLMALGVVYYFVAGRPKPQTRAAAATDSVATD